MTGWDTLLSTALVGTGRRAPNAAALAGLVEPGRVHAEGPEATVLASAALLEAYRRAGWQPPVRRDEPPRPAVPDDRPECSATAAQVLELLLDRAVRVEGGNEPLIRQWLQACVAAGQLPPPRLLVSLLKLGTVSTGLRDTVREAAGPRGAWLGRRNPRWTWAASADPADAHERFPTATRAERLALLAVLRRGDPATARDLIEGTWPSEQAATRAELLDALAVGLSDEDEPFLESALDDRAATVRAAAAALLDRLPTSRRAARMAARVRALTTPDGTVELPGEPDAAARRDGITDRREPPHGLRAGWLIQLVGAAPLPPVPDLRGATPELLAGWTRAALRQRDEGWLAALAEHDPTPDVLAALPPGEASRIVARVTNDATFARLLSACPGPWPRRFSADVVDRLGAVKSDRPLTTAFQAFVERLDPAALPAVQQWLDNTARTQRARRRMLSGLTHALTIRRTIQQEFP